MRDQEPTIKQHRTARLETLERRVVLSANISGQLALGSSFYDTQVETQIVGELQTMLADAHDQTGLTDVRSDFGFDGAGQTVAVIDSGIAWDHPALGGGLGTSFQVVGGYDFTENDNNPYDDGPLGSHGTHVSGIIGADGGANSGVAPGVDLVSLRVFDDNGNGLFSWVEDALQWVHDHRNDFDNPITTVNLSLGTDWNSDSVPNWAMLEDEFALLETDGIFIAVAAGNSFQDYLETGLSYPAVSSYVVPVMSVDPDGNLSYFSQRDQGAIAAPGRWITSTVPDYVGNFNGKTDDWASFSGTSMAAPYVAGASVLVREAMQFVGTTGITQDAIYDVMIDTADRFYDVDTSAWYSSLNLEAAIDSIMPDDDFGSSAANAYELGNLIGYASIDGLIGKLNDIDYFEFTAQTSGSVIVTAQTTHDMHAQWDLVGGVGTTSGSDGEVFNFDVIAGQSYTFGISGDSLGYFSLDVDQGDTFTNWGQVDYRTESGISQSGDDQLLRIQAAHSGILTAEAIFAQAGGNVDLSLYNANLELLASSNSSTGNERIDLSVNAGDVLFLAISGDNANIDLTVANLVRVSGSTVDVFGTSGNDHFTFEAGATHQLTVNQISYSFDAASATTFTFDGRAGYDTASLVGTAGDEHFELRPGRVELVGASFTAAGESLESIDVFGNGGDDRAKMNGSSGDDIFRGYETHSTLTGANFTLTAHDIDRIYAYGRGGSDEAYLYDSAGNDVFRGTASYSRLWNDGFNNYVKQFDQVEAFSTGGGDRAYLYGSSGNDTLNGTDSDVELFGSGFYNRAEGFTRTYNYGKGGNDRAKLVGSTGNDVYYSDNVIGRLRGADFNHYVKDFDRVDAYSNGGSDRAYLYGTSGDEVYRGNSVYAQLSGDGFFHRATAFERVYIYPGKGHDQALLTGTANRDAFHSLETYSRLVGVGYNHYLKGFEQIDVTGAGGNDSAYLYDSASDDQLTVRAAYVAISRDDYYAVARGFKDVTATSSLGGVDTTDEQAVDYLFTKIGDWQ